MRSWFASLGMAIALVTTFSATTHVAKASDVPAYQVWLEDRQNKRIDLDTSGIEFNRSAPKELGKKPFEPSSDLEDAGFRFVFVGNADSLPPRISVVSSSSEGVVIDRLADVPLQEIPCAKGTASGVTCASTLPLRTALDDVDKAHVWIRDRAIKTELDGKVRAFADGHELLVAKVLGPRSTSIGALNHYRAKLRPLVVRDRAGGNPPFGLDDRAATQLVRQQIARANIVWGQCGIEFGPPDKVDVKVVDPPPSSMLAVGCDLGLPAAGGDVVFRVDNTEIKVSTKVDQTPRSFARALAKAIEAKGFVVVVSENAKIGPGALPTSDLLVKRKGGKEFAHVSQVDTNELSNDISLKVCLGRVDLTDGLQHFSDVDAVAGSLEERALLKAFDDGDPTTIEIVYIPSFSTGGRIGESFIRGDRSSLSNMLIVDRAGVRGDAVSFALAHELGHVLLDQPGHTDDYGTDTPTRLMDSDSADATAFGPRRLLASECAKAFVQSGPNAPTALLSPITVIHAPPKKSTGGSTKLR